MKLFKSKKRRRENLNIIIMSCLIFLVLVLLLIKNNIDYNVLKEQILVSSSDEFVLALEDNKNLLLETDLSVNLNNYILDHDINIDLNGKKLILTGCLVVNDNTINIIDETDGEEGILDITNLMYDVEYTCFDEPINRDISIITSDIDTNNIYINENDDVNTATLNDDSGFEVYYPYINYVYQSQKEALELDDYLYNNNNYESMVITKPVASHLKDAIIQKNITININDEGKVVLSGDVTFNEGMITINISDNNQIDISRLNIKLDCANKDTVLFQVNGIELSGLELPKNTFISDNKIIYRQ